MRRLIVFLPLVFLLALAARGVAGVAVPVIERHLAHEAAEVVATLEADWAEIAVEGRRLRVTGTPPDAEAGALLARTLARALPLALVERAPGRQPLKALRRPPMLVELFRQGDGIVVTGSFPGPAARADLLIALGSAFPEARIADLSGVEAGGAPGAWGAAVAVAVAALGEVPEAFVRLEPQRAAISGVAASEGERQRLEDLFARVSGPALEVATALVVPLRPIVPFETRIAADEAGRPGFETCAARDAEEARRLEAALAAAAGGPERRACRAGAGAPGLDWEAAVEAGIAAVEGLPGALFTLRGTLARLEAAPGAAIARPDFERALARLAGRLPPGFALDASLAARDGTAEAADPGMMTLGWIVIERDAAGIRLTGTVASAEVARLLETMAAGAVGRARVDATGLAVAAGAPGTAAAPVLSRSAVAALDALAGAGVTGRAAIGPGRLGVSATLADAGAAAGLQRRLADGLAPGVVLSTRLTVDLPAAVAARPLPPGACAAGLNRVVAARPVSFAPGSAELDARAERVVDRLAAVLSRCRDAVIEIGGHTDNQGRASMNRRLSRARAEAVRAALLGRSVDPRRARLSAAGYGEADPVADNATEAGRALNRRIAFRALDPSPAAAAE